MVFPVLWISEGVDVIDGSKTVSFLKTAVFTPELLKSALCVKSDFIFNY